MAHDQLPVIWGDFEALLTPALDRHQHLRDHKVGQTAQVHRGAAEDTRLPAAPAGLVMLSGCSGGLPPLAMGQA